MNIRIEPSTLDGTVAAIPSKSEAHRALICAAFADAQCTVQLSNTSADIEATVGVLESLGAVINRDGYSCKVNPVTANNSSQKSGCTLFCGESGSTARFILPVAAAVCNSVTLTGSGRLPERPMTSLCSELRLNGCTVSADYIPLSVEGKLKGGVFTFPGNISSQYITGMLLALPIVTGGGEIRISTALESSSYVDITLSVLKKFGVEPQRTEHGFICQQQAYLSPETYPVEGDWSNAAFWLCASFLGSSINVTGLNPQSFQGDRAVVNVLEQFKFSGMVLVDARNIPDLVPVLAAASCGRHGTTIFSGCARLRLKESDRIDAVCIMIKSLGGTVYAKDDSITVEGTGSLAGGTVDGMNDHRIVMAAAVASIICRGDVTILGTQAADKSYPAFFNDFINLGGSVHVIDVR